MRELFWVNTSRGGCFLHLFVLGNWLIDNFVRYLFSAMDFCEIRRYFYFSKHSHLVHFSYRVQAAIISLAPIRRGMNVACAVVTTHLVKQLKEHIIKGSMVRHYASRIYANVSEKLGPTLVSLHIFVHLWLRHLRDEITCGCPQVSPVM